jgi:hypothetical protein
VAERSITTHTHTHTQVREWMKGIALPSLVKPSYVVVVVVIVVASLVALQMATPPSCTTPLLLSFSVIKLEANPHFRIGGSTSTASGAVPIQTRTLRTWHWQHFLPSATSSDADRRKEDEYTSHAELFCFPDANLPPKATSEQQQQQQQQQRDLHEAVLLDVEPGPNHEYHRLHKGDIVSSRGRQAYVFALTDAQGRRTFGFCLRLKAQHPASSASPNSPVPSWTLCILSHLYVDRRCRCEPDNDETCITSHRRCRTCCCCVGRNTPTTF